MILYAAIPSTIILGGTPLPKLIGSPRDLHFRMTESELANQKSGLFPGPSVLPDNGGSSFKTFMEIDGMGSPGHRSYYYLFEDNELHGVVQTTSLLGIEKAEATRIAALNYKKVLELVTGQPDTTEILRADGGGFSRVTLETWSIDDDPGMKVFHVSTNCESTVGVLYGKTHFPTDQLFVSSDDKRFQGQIGNNGTIVDVSRAILQSSANPKDVDRNRPSGESGISNRQFGDPNPSHQSNENGAVHDGKSTNAAFSYSAWILAVIVILGILFVIWKGKKGDA